MRASELRKKDEKELKKDLELLKEKLSNLYFKVAANKLKNVKEIKYIKKDIARILTILNEKLKIKK